MGHKCQYLAKKANFGPNLAVYGPKILGFMGVSKSSGTHITEKSRRQLFQIVFWSGMGSNGPKYPYLTTSASFGPNLAVFGPNNPIFDRMG